MSGFTLFSNHVPKSAFCVAHHILKPAVALASPASIRFIGSREIAMTLQSLSPRMQPHSNGAAVRSGGSSWKESWKDACERPSVKLPNISSATAGNCRRIRRVEGAPAEPFAAKRGAWQSINSTITNSDRAPVSFALANEMRQFVMAITHPQPLTVPGYRNPHGSS